MLPGGQFARRRQSVSVWRKILAMVRRREKVWSKRTSNASIKKWKQSARKPRHMSTTRREPKNEITV